MFANIWVPHAMALHRILYVMEEKPAQEEDKQKEVVIEMDVLSNRIGKICQVHFIRHFPNTNLPCTKIDLFFLIRFLMKTPLKGLFKQLCSLHPWRSLKLIWMKPWITWSDLREPCFLSEIFIETSGSFFQPELFCDSVIIRNFVHQEVHLHIWKQSRQWAYSGEFVNMSYLQMSLSAAISLNCR